MKRIKRFIKEIITVMIGILIALFINDWNDERKEKKYLDQIYSSIQNELKESLEDIERVIPKQLASVDTVQAYLNDTNITLYDIMVKSDGVYSPNIKTTSWNAISNSRIELIEYDRLSALADIADRKKNLSNRIDKQLEFIFENFEETDKVKKEILSMMILDIVGTEKRLQNAIEEIIKQ